jgi:hypothetical protein
MPFLAESGHHWDCVIGDRLLKCEFATDASLKSKGSCLLRDARAN